MNGGKGGQADSLFDRLYQRAKRIDVDGETYWRVEGDTLLDEDQLRLYAQQRKRYKRRKSQCRKPDCRWLRLRSWWA